MKRSIPRIFSIAVVVLAASMALQCSMFFGKKDKKQKSPWQPVASLAQGRALLATAVVNNQIYAIGGALTDNTALNDVEAYSIEKDKWTKMAPMPTPRADLAVGVIGQRIYAVGGYDAEDPNYYLNDLEVFDPVSNTWEKKTPMPTRRSGLGVGVVNGKLYAIGGNCDRNWESGCLYMVEEYDPATDKWSTMEALPTPRSDLAIAVMKDKIYAIGGAIYDGGEWYYFADVEAYDPGSNTWQKLGPMPTARCDCAATVMGGKIYVAGGICNIKDSKRSLSLNDVEVFNGSRWGRKAPLSGVRYSLGLSNVNGKLYSVGGIVGSDYLNLVEAYAP